MPDEAVLIMSEQPEERPPMAVASEWVSRVTAISAEMVLPGLGGHWLDQRWGTNIFVLVGFVLGVSLGIWHLVVLSQASLEQEKKRQKKGDSSSDDSSEEESVKKE